MAASDYDAQAIRSQLFTMSDHILRRLEILLERAHADSHPTYPDFEATALELCNVQRQLRDELSRPWPQREQRDHLMALMLVQERSLLVLEELDLLSFDQVAVPSQPIVSAAQQPFGRRTETKIARWTEDDLNPELPPAGPARRPLVGPEAEVSGSPRRLQTRSSLRQQFPFMHGQARVQAWPRTLEPVEPSLRPPHFREECDDVVEIAASADQDDYLEPPPPEPPSRPSAGPVPISHSPRRLQQRSSGGHSFSVKPSQAPVRSLPRAPAPVELSPREPARVAPSGERQPNNAASNRVSPPLRLGSPPTASAFRPVASPASTRENQRTAALPVPASAPPDLQSHVSDLSGPSAKERIGTRLGATWGMFRRLLQMVVTAVFIVLGIVALALVSHLAMTVTEGLNTPDKEIVIHQRVNERLSTRDADSVSADASATTPMPPTGDAFVVVLSMHPDAAAAQRTFAEMRQTMATILTDLKPDIQPVETPNGIRYRLALASPMSRERAYALCSEFKAVGFQACWLRRLQR